MCKCARTLVSSRVHLWEGILSRPRVEAGVKHAEVERQAAHEEPGLATQRLMVFVGGDDVCVGGDGGAGCGWWAGVGWCGGRNVVWGGG